MAHTRGRRLIQAAESAIWAIQEEKLAAILEVLEAREGGRMFSAEEIEARIGSQDRPKERRGGGVAVLPLFGVIGHRMGSFQDISGGTSTERFMSRIDEILADDSIGTIVLDVNSPGGTVYGVAEAAAKLFEARGSKKIIAVSNALMASAAYWIGAAADEVVITPSGEAGSIGVFMVHTEFSKLEEEVGVKRTIIRAGRFKAEATQYEPLSDEARAHIQSSVADYYDLFTDAVAKYRGVKTSAVKNGFGEGLALTAKRAVSDGLADRIATLDEVLVDLGVRSSHSRAARASLEVVEPTAVDDEGKMIRGYEEAEAVAERLAAVRDAADLVAGLEAGTTSADTIRVIESLDQLDAYMQTDAGHVLSQLDDLLGRPTIVHAAQDDDEEVEELDGPDPDESEDETQDDLDAADGGADQVETKTPDSTPPVGRENTVDPKDTAAQQGAAAPNATINRDAQEAERKRCQDIAQLCSAHGMPDKAADFIEQGFSADRAGREILQLRETDRPGSTHAPAKPAVELTEKENKRYSVARLAMAAANGRPEAAGFEFEVHQELERDLNYSPKGILVPTTLGIDRQAYPKRELQKAGYFGQLTTDTTGGGEELVFIEPGSFIEMLRSRLVAAAMGATFLPGLRGNVDFPKQTGAGEYSWVGENEAPGDPDQPSDSDLDTGLVSLRPKNGRSITSFSRTLLAQSVINVEQLVRADLAAITARGIDRAVLHGTGANNQPTGVYVASGVNPVAFDGSISYEKVVEMETRIAESDADIDAMGYVSTPGVRGAAKTTLTFPSANTGAPIWTGGVRDGQVNGFRAMASTQLRKDLGAGSEHGLVFGAWQHALIGEWGAMDVLVDPYTRGGKGLIRMIVFSIADVALRYPEAFSKATGLTVAADAS